MNSDFPYRPPSVPIPPGVAAALDLAFGPVDGEGGFAAEFADPEGVVEAARRMVLSGRIAARWPASLLQGVLGVGAAEACRLDLRGLAVAELRAEAIVQTIAASADSMDLPVVFLKGAAMVMEGLILPGSRGLGDVDVLAPEGREVLLQERLKAEGCVEPEDLPSGEHQLQALAHPLGLAVEVHLCLRGVRNADQNSMTLTDLRQTPLVRLLPGLPGEAYVPSRDMLLAHAIVHGLAQHGLNPKSYPMLRFVADIIDLDLAGALDRGDFERWKPMVERDVSFGEIQALGEMCRRLTGPLIFDRALAPCHSRHDTGEGCSLGDRAAAVWAGDDDPALMLRHLVLGAVDVQYRDSLRIRSLVSVLPSRGRGTTLLRTVWSTTVLTRGQVEALYGKPGSAWGYLLYRLFRPFDLAWRTLCYGVAAIKGRFR